MTTTPATGQQLTSPVVVSGSFVYNGGTLVSAVPASGGTFTLSSGKATVTNSNVTSNSVMMTGMNTSSGTVAAPPNMTSVSVGSSFVVSGGSSDTSTYNYVILG
jgi:hypothetical protein